MTLGVMTFPVVTDPEGGYYVLDPRDDEPLAWRGYGSAAYLLAEELERAYDSERPLPAYDTLVHEIIGWRISGRVR